MCRIRSPRHSFHSLSTPSHLFGEASPALHALLPAVHLGSEFQAPGCRSMAPAHFPDFGATPLPCAHSPGEQSYCLHTLHLDRTPPLLSEISTTSYTEWILLCPVPRAHLDPSAFRPALSAGQSWCCPFCSLVGHLAPISPYPKMRNLTCPVRYLDQNLIPRRLLFLGSLGDFSMALEGMRIWNSVFVFQPICLFSTPGLSHSVQCWLPCPAAPCPLPFPRPTGLPGTLLFFLFQ